MSDQTKSAVVYHPQFLCYGCEYLGRSSKTSCGCTIDIDGGCPESESGEHEVEPWHGRLVSEGPLECIGKRCDLCGACEVA
jgi:hypothetical protein